MTVSSWMDPGNPGNPGMYRTVMRKYKAQDGSSDEYRNMSEMRIKARRGLAIIWGT